MNKPTITHEMVKELDSPDITHRRYTEILDLISDRVDVIWRYIMKVSNRKLGWYCFSTDIHAFDNSGNGSDGGYFDPKRYNKFIELVGEFTCHYDNNFYEYNDGFPTELLWDENYKETILASINKSKEKFQKEKEKDKTTRLERGRKKDALIASIKTKLTKEELKLVKFK